MSTQYNETRSYSKYLSSNPDDSGLRIRLSGPLLFVYNTARAIDFSQYDTKRNTRGGVTRFSAGAADRMGRYLRECVADYRNMATLTYPSDYPIDGAVVKGHLATLFKRIRRLIASNDASRLSTYSHFWFLEFQTRGAPHFHFFTTEFISHEWLAQAWYEIVGSGDRKHLHAGTSIEKLRNGRGGTISYAKKYARKQAQKEVPEKYLNCGRFWGICGMRARVAATITFYKDKLANSGVLAVKRKLLNVIKEHVDNGTLIMKRRSEGFCCFRVIDHLQSRSFQSIINESYAALSEFEAEMFCDADLTYINDNDDIVHVNESVVYDRFTGKLLTGAELYKYMKYGA